MEQLHLDLLDRARGLASAKALIDRAIQELIAELVSAEIETTALSQALAMHGSTEARSTATCPPSLPISKLDIERRIGPLGLSIKVAS